MYKTGKSFDVIKAVVPDFSKVYKEKLLNGTDPVLTEDLVPIHINLENGTVTKANIEDKWYDYSNKEWANAVILTDSGKEKKYQDGATIEETDIESYFVWIPKYQYRIQTLTQSTAGNEKEFEIKFGTYNTQDKIENECVAPESGSNGNCNVGDWMTHPAFISFSGSKGMWVGKFETGYKDASSIYGNSHNELNVSKIIVKPNRYCWRLISLYNKFYNSYNYKRNLDSHLMKNTEWGAVAYLSHSKYGTCTESKCSELLPNTNVNFLTGYTNNSDYFNSSIVSRASTTGNYTGIYDMSGGNWEYTAAFMKNGSSAGYILGYSGFTMNDTLFKNDSEIDYSKYYDVYASTQDVSGRILGDATAETLGWYGDFGAYINAGLPFFGRGSDENNETRKGIFALYPYNGEPSYFSTFRIVLSPSLSK